MSNELQEIKEGIFEILFGTCMHINDSPDEKTDEILQFLADKGLAIPWKGGYLSLKALMILEKEQEEKK